MTVYVIDTSALISAKYYYPPKNMTSFWDDLHELNLKNKLIIIERVKSELKSEYLKDDFLKDKIITKEDTPEVIKHLNVLMKSLPKKHQVGLTQWLKVADPYVIATALKIINETNENTYVLHGELARGEMIKIPYLCNLLKIRHDKIHRIITEEDFEYNKVS